MASWPAELGTDLGDDVVRDRPRRRVPAPVGRLGLAIHRGLQRLADRVLPADLVLLEHAVADLRAGALAAVAELGVADLMSGPCTAAELADRLDVDAGVLHRLLRALVLDGIFTLDARGRFRLTRTGHRLRSDHPESMRPVIRYWSTDTRRRAWAGLTDVVRTGRPAFPAATGRSVWEWFEQQPLQGRIFAAAMRRLTEIDVPDVLGLYPWPAHGTVCDVAGGAGTLLARILQARPLLRGVLVEGPVALTAAEPVLQRHAVRDRVELVGGDLFTGFTARADVYVLRAVLHDWDDVTCHRILSVTRAAMPPGATLVVVDLLQEPNVAGYPVSLVDLQMAVVCDAGRERSADELRALLRAAGFVPGSLRRAATGLGVLTASVAGA